MGRQISDTILSALICEGLRSALTVRPTAADGSLVHLPEVGIRGNTHFLMSDLNNVQIADQVSQFLAGKKLS